jgi:hypothetical protein
MREMNAAEDVTYEKTVAMIHNATWAEEKPIDYCHKAVAFRPFGWQILQDYVHDLENYIKYKCK